MAAFSSRSFHAVCQARQFSFATFVFCQRLNSNVAVKGTLNYQDSNHCSRLRGKLTFATEYRGIFIQKDLEHLLSLKDVKINKNNVNNISINDPHRSQGTDESSLFLYDKIPSLKYNNPDISIVCTRDETKPWEVKVVLASGDEIVVPTVEKTSEEIFSDLCNVICEKT